MPKIQPATQFSSNEGEPSVNGSEPVPGAGSISPNSEPKPEAKPAADPFDPEALRIGSMDNVEVEKVLTAVPVRKPKRADFIRVHPEHALDTLLLERESEMDRESYLVAPTIQHLVLPELQRTRLHVSINKRGTVFLWPIKLPREDTDRFRRVSETALLAAMQARDLWVRVWWNADLGGYEFARAKGDLGQPQWPDKSFRDLLEIAFRSHVIDREDHPVIRELAGEL